MRESGNGRASFPWGGVGFFVAVAAGFVTLYFQQRDIIDQLRALRAQVTSPAQPSAARAAAPQPQRPPLPADLNLSLDAAAITGRADAKVTMVEFSDFQCPFCGRYIRETWPQIQRDYVATGKVRYAFRHFPLESLHPNAFGAAEAGECLRQQGKFWEMHELLFQNQDALGRPALTAYATKVGADPKAFQQCMAGTVGTKIRADLDAGTRVGVTGTPAFFLGTSRPDGTVHIVNRLDGAQPFSTFKSALDELLK